MTKISIYDCASGFFEDYERLIHAFCEKKSTLWSVFEEIWMNLKFDCLFDFRLNDKECREFTEECMRIITVYLLAPSPPEVRICSLFSLYALHQTHPFPTPVGIRLMLGQWKDIRCFMAELEKLNEIIYMSTLTYSNDGVLGVGANVSLVAKGGVMGGRSDVVHGEASSGLGGSGLVVNGDNEMKKQVKDDDVKSDDDDYNGVLNISELVDESLDNTLDTNPSFTPQIMKSSMLQLPTLHTVQQSHTTEANVQPLQQSLTQINNSTQQQENKKTTSLLQLSQLKPQQQLPLQPPQQSPPQQQPLQNTQTYTPKYIQTYQDVIDIFNLLKQQQAFIISPDGWFSGIGWKKGTGGENEEERMEFLKRRGCVLEKIFSSDILQEFESLWDERSDTKSKLTLKTNSLSMGDQIPLLTTQVQDLIKSYHEWKTKMLHQSPNTKTTKDGKIKSKSNDEDEDEEDEENEEEERAGGKRSKVLKRAYSQIAPTERFFEKKPKRKRRKIQSVKDIDKNMKLKKSNLVSKKTKKKETKSMDGMKDRYNSSDDCDENEEIEGSLCVYNDESLDENNRKDNVDESNDNLKGKKKKRKIKIKVVEVDEKTKKNGHKEKSEQINKKKKKKKENRERLDEKKKKDLCNNSMEKGSKEGKQKKTKKKSGVDKDGKVTQLEDAAKPMKKILKEKKENNNLEEKNNKKSKKKLNEKRKKTLQNKNSKQDGEKKGSKKRQASKKRETKNNKTKINNNNKLIINDNSTNKVSEIVNNKNRNSKKVFVNSENTNGKEKKRKKVKLDQIPVRKSIKK